MENQILFHIGPLAINDAVVTTWIIMALLAVFSLLVTRRLRLQPGPLQTALEGGLGAIDDAVRATSPPPPPWRFWCFSRCTGSASAAKA